MKIQSFLVRTLLLIGMGCLAFYWGWIKGMAPLRSASPHSDLLRKTPVVRALERALPCIVYINAETTAVLKGKPSVAVRPGTRQAYVIQPLRGVKSLRRGAGVIMDREGFILTNAHVVEDMAKVNVTFNDGTETEGEVVGLEEKYDLAIVKVALPHRLREMPFADSGALFLGEPVIAVGNPHGLEKSVSAGIISGLQRDILWKQKKLVYEGLIQSDIPLSVGSSGGPLLNIHGELVGINLAAPVGTEGISFAIPSNTAKKVYGRYHK